MARSFSQVDVFAAEGFVGNPVAVVHDAEGITTEQMLQFTSWTNLSEATFLLPPTHPDADYRVRIFCPGRELPFAGHPTLGTCAAWRAAGGVPKRAGSVVQECGAGLIHIRVETGVDGSGEDSGEDAGLAFAAPPMTRSGPVEPELLAERRQQLGLTAAEIVDTAWIDNGPGWMGLLLHSADAVLDVALPTASVAGFDVGLLGLHPPDSEHALEVRGLFADESGAIREDPVTGSLNASAAQWLLATGRLTAPYLARQGTAIGRRGRISITEADGEIWVGGATHVAIRGTIDL